MPMRGAEVNLTRAPSLSSAIITLFIAIYLSLRPLRSLRLNQICGGCGKSRFQRHALPANQIAL